MMKKTFSVSYLVFKWKKKRFFSFSQRQCMIISDIAEIQSSPYFRSNCIRQCRLQSIIALCNCIPFFYLDLMPDSTNSTKVCTLDKVPCLSHYSGIYTYAYELINKVAPLNLIACTLFSSSSFSCSFTFLSFVRTLQSNGWRRCFHVKETWVWKQSLRMVYPVYIVYRLALKQNTLYQRPDYHCEHYRPKHDTQADCKSQQRHKYRIYVTCRWHLHAVFP